jgi:hypothetical protein
MDKDNFVEARDRPGAIPAVFPPEQVPLLLVVVDTEEEFDWRLPHSRDNTRVTAITAQGLAQEIFARHGIVPTYVLDYPVAKTPAAVSVLKPFADQGACLIGTHLHPWVNPPHVETVNTVNSYPGNLSPSLERAKLTTLTESIVQAFGASPVIYKAGRYGVGPATAGILVDLGYKIDVSVVPYTDFSADGGPDFSRIDFRPAWIGERGSLLEIPLSCGFCGLLKSLGPTLFPRMSGRAGMRLHLPGVLARSRLLERIRLTPEGVDLAANIRLARSLYEQGCRIFSFTYHSPSLLPGMTPYVSSERELGIFLESMDRFFAFFRQELGGRPSDPLEVYRLLRPERETAEGGVGLRALGG